MTTECEKLKICGFFKKYTEMKSLVCKGFIRSYCEGGLQNECKRKEYSEMHGEPPPDDMMPNGRYVISGRQTNEYGNIQYE